jgi:calmodulin
LLNFIFEYLELRDAFNLFDRDKSGAISLLELKQVLVALNFNPTDSLLRKVMKQMDSDKNGSGKFNI